MSVIFFLVALALVIAGAFLGLFFWAVRSGQYNDTDGPAMRMLHDAAQPRENKPKI